MDLLSRLSDAIYDYEDAVGCRPGRIVCSPEFQKALIAEANWVRYALRTSGERTRFVFDGVPVDVDRKAPPGTAYCAEATR